MRTDPAERSRAIHGHSAMSVVRTVGLENGMTLLNVRARLERMDMNAATESWLEEGFVVLPGYLPADVLGPAVHELDVMFPSSDDFHDEVAPDRNARFIDDEFNGMYPGLDMSPWRAAV